MKKITFPFLIVLGFVAGCSSTARGPEYKLTNYYSQNAESDKASVLIFRKPAGMLASARSTRMLLDNKPIAHCDINGFTALELKPGDYSISADLPDAAGKCTVKLRAEAGKKYYYEVAPRPISAGTMMAGLLGGAVGAAIADNAVNSGLECGGAFSIVSVEKDYGEASLLSMRLSQ